jgi:hypothetical protein
MKLSQDKFSAAIEPALADLEREHPSLLRFEELPDDLEMHARLWDSTGAGTGVYLEADEGPMLVAEAAGHVQDAAMEALWREEMPTSWPSCPLHPDNHPLRPGQRDGSAVWLCAADDRAFGIIGSLTGS